MEQQETVTFQRKIAERTRYEETHFLIPHTALFILLHEERRITIGYPVRAMIIRQANIHLYFISGCIGQKWQAATPFCLSVSLAPGCANYPYSQDIKLAGRWEVGALVAGIERVPSIAHLTYQVTYPALHTIPVIFR